MKMKVKSALWMISVGVMLPVCARFAMGQTPSSEAPAKPLETKSAPQRSEPEAVETFYLNSVTQVNDANEILTMLRNILDPRVRIYLMTSENAITMRASADQLAIARRLLKELDRPKKTFRLIYTVTEMDSGRRIGVQHFAMVLAPGGRGTVMKQGSRVPVVVANTDTSAAGMKTQVTYLDVGLNIDASIDGYVDGVRLRTKVEQSSVAEERSLATTDPVIRQTMLEGTAILTQGKPLVLGSMDVPGSTRHQEVEVVLEPVP